MNPAYPPNWPNDDEEENDDGWWYENEALEEEPYDEYYDGTEDGAYYDPDYAFFPEGPAEQFYPDRPDLSVPIGIAAFIFLVFALGRGALKTTGAAPPVPAAVAAETMPLAVQEDEPADPSVFVAPYDDYVLTQGVHGQSYGHMAIDLAAGKGAPVLSPINGVITGKYIDRYGNPTLLIENDLYVVTLLHGIYSAEEGDQVRAGQHVGIESNLGYTTDMRGVPCAGRIDYCGYHTHLNVYNKELRSNVNPLKLISP